LVFCVGYGFFPRVATVLLVGLCLWQGQALGLALALLWVDVVSNGRFLARLNTFFVRHITRIYQHLRDGSIAYEVTVGTEKVEVFACSKAEAQALVGAVGVVSSVRPLWSEIFVK
jgi:hypothetical protein